MTSIGFHARITNPLTLGYYAYLACFDSWRKIADKVVVVDGGSTDDSIELLRHWVSDDPKIQVIDNEVSHWGQNFAWEQSTLNMQLGHDALDDCDWIIRADADHVVDIGTANHLLEELETRFSQSLSVAFDVYFFRNGRYHRRSTPRNWILNNRLARSHGLKVGWGKNELNGLLTDEPLKITREVTFIDPETDMVKPLGVGVPLGSVDVCALKVYRYGHFFFSPGQAIAKCKIWDDAVVRFTGKHPKTRLELRLEADVIGILRYMSQKEVLAHPHPAEMKRLGMEYYQPGMLGGALYASGSNQLRSVLWTLIHGFNLVKGGLARQCPR